MKRITLLAAALIFAATAFSQATWTSDKAHSKLGFGITHLTISEVDGVFKNFDSKFTSSKDDFSDAVIELTADINSISTDDDKRDGHLKSPDFFDAAKFATLSFKSTSFTKTGPNQYKLNGNLTLHGVTKPVTLDVVLNGVINDPMSKKTKAGFKISGKLKRSDFGVGGNFPAMVLSDEVTINGNTEFYKG